MSTLAKHIIIFSTCLLLVACSDPSSSDNDNGEVQNQPDINIFPGYQLGEISIRSDVPDVLNVLGVPITDEGIYENGYLKYRDIRFDGTRGITRVVFNDPLYGPGNSIYWHASSIISSDSFSGITQNNIGIGNIVSEFVDAYGSPDSTTSDRHYYNNLGIIFYTSNDTITNICIKERNFRQYLKYCCFVDENVGLASTGGSDLLNSGILRTDDGGTTWENVHDVSDWIYQDIVLLDSGFLYTYSKHSYSSSTILTSNDNGLSWSERDFDFESQRLRNLQFMNTSEGFITTSDFVLKTNDCCQSYEIKCSLEEFGSDVNYFTKSIFINDTKGYLTVNRTEPEALMYETNDGGETWSEFSVPGYNYIRNMKFYNSHYGCFVLENNDDDRALLVTNDGGNNWETIVPPTEVLFEYSDIEYSDSNTIFIVGGDEIWRSDDGGHIWSKCEYDFPASVVSTSFISNQSGYITGKNGSILKTSDSGETWDFIYGNFDQ